jgi:hypothetical protein
VHEIADMVVKDFVALRALPVDPSHRISPNECWTQDKSARYL